MEPVAAAVCALTFVAFILLIPPFIWHYKCLNIATVCLISWLMISNITSFINLLIWSDPDFRTRWDGKVYCDIVVKLNIGGQVGKVCAITALSIQLFMVIKATNPIFMDNKNRKKIIFDLCVCLITPVFVMATNYIVQVQRFAIFRYQGCANLVVPSVPSILLYSIWDLGWSIVATFFAAATIIAYFIKRREVKDVLKCTNAGFTFKRFARLLIFSVLVVLVLCPLACYFFAMTFKQDLIPFKWSYVHSRVWGRIYYYHVGWEQLFDKFIDIGLSIIAFLIFGLGSDAVEMYKNILLKLRIGRVMGIKEKNGFEIENENSMSRMTTQTRIGTNSTTKSGTSYGSKQTGTTAGDEFAMTDLDMEYRRIMNDNEELFTTAKKSPVTIQTIDLEKGQDHDLSNYLENDSLQSMEDELHHIINMASEPDEAMSFNFQVTRKP